jgi:hypothetical protein
LGRIVEASRGRGGSRKQKPVVYIVCEGEKSEPKYFRNFSSRNSLVNIKPVTSQYKDAFNLVKNAEREIQPDEYFPEYGDQVWCVFDRDNNSDDELYKAKALAERRGYRIAFSNPCFEYWYLLHFIEYRAYLADCDAVVKLLEARYIPQYIKSGDYFRMLRLMRADAIARANKVLQGLEQDGIGQIHTSSNPSTSAVLLVLQL